MQESAFCPFLHFHIAVHQYYCSFIGSPNANCIPTSTLQSLVMLFHSSDSLVVKFVEENVLEQAIGTVFGKLII